MFVNKHQNTVVTRVDFVDLFPLSYKLDDQTDNLFESTSKCLLFQNNKLVFDQKNKAQKLLTQ